MEQIIKTSWQEFWPIINILNEVCHGIHIDNFEVVVGCKYEEIIALIKKIKACKEEDDNDPIELTLNAFEIGIIKSSYKEVLNQIEEWEFQTRIGVSIAEVNKIINKLA